jgi:hypothetical protein
VQVDPIKPKLKPPGTERLKLSGDALLSTSAFKFNLRRYIKDIQNWVRMGRLVGPGRYGSPRHRNAL